jgi:arginine N-succinyltransferase
MPPLDNKGNSPLWEAIGRKFLNMDYLDADRLSRQNKEFIFSLFPSETIYEALLPLEARDAIGKVNEHTEPVKAMLLKAGFKYMHEVDPFDGGPHFRAQKSEIVPIKNIAPYSIEQTSNSPIEGKPMALEVQHPDHEFYCILGLAVSKENTVKIDHELDPKIAKEKGNGFFY